MTDVERPYDPDQVVRLHSLTYLEEDGEITIGRTEIDSYAVFPADGAAFVQRLQNGETPRQAALWYSSVYDEEIDAAHIVGALEELGFLRTGGEPAEATGPVRWQGLGRALFSPVAWVLYGALLGWAGILMVRSTDLVPTYHDLFFTEYYTIVVVGLFVGAMPLALLHESFHALAGRRLGLRSRLRIGRRFYFIVLETSLDGLVAVPRRKRYLPILAGLVADVLVVAVLVIGADLSRLPDGSFSRLGMVCQAFTFATVLRIVWQFFFYLRTDIYILITTVLGCSDLHGTAKQMVTDRVRRGFGRAPVADPSQWHPVDRQAARWYSWLIVAGYSFSGATLLFAAIPASYHVFAGIVDRFVGGATTAQTVDSALFLALNVPQFAFTVWLGIRERRERAAATFNHVIA
ncbi:hypothetical protein GCM10010172_03360 [Paractinoplanes ferrugineus]|uniref:Uncharacterized protein n=1 Tax=Paractinoplanes ferrugineus TaxID=113564 RepID=A0A919MBJ9_9ACTN|nr:hypothetical protein [Actinoplanes ferrugineus]GIE13741.1 hypothetical protein Afe05nite_55810 [Actinoplanes ferrugineus]